MKPGRKADAIEQLRLAIETSDSVRSSPAARAAAAQHDVRRQAGGMASVLEDAVARR